MATKRNYRAIAGSGSMIGAALSARELQAVATAVKAAAEAVTNADERNTLDRAFAKLRSAHDWQAKNVTSRGL